MRLKKKRKFDKLSEAEKEINSANIKITKCYAIEPEILCDEVYIKEALTNILNNAIEVIKETKKNDGEIKISVIKKNRVVNVSIEDNGIGISKEAQNRISYPFFSTKTSGRHFGLGLAYVYHIMELHKFKINITGKEGVGTIVSFSFPIKREKLFFKNWAINRWKYYKK